MHSSAAVQTDLDVPLADPAFTRFCGERGDFRLSGTVSVPVAA